MPLRRLRCCPLAEHSNRVRLASDVSPWSDGSQKHLRCVRWPATSWLHAKGDERVQLALRYGLITDETSAVLVQGASGGDKAEGLQRSCP